MATTAEFASNNIVNFKTWNMLNFVLEIKASGDVPYIRDPFYLQELTIIPAWISNYIHFKVWDEIAYPFLNFNAATVEV